MAIKLINAYSKPTVIFIRGVELIKVKNYKVEADRGVVGAIFVLVAV